jgi:hypothetical protein
VLLPFIDCSGIHRGLGVDYSQVRSLTLDMLEPVVIEAMAALGNAVVNGIYESSIDPEFQRPTPNCCR